MINSNRSSTEYGDSRYTFGDEDLFYTGIPDEKVTEIYLKFKEFHEHNGHILDELLKMIDAIKNRGHTKIGMGMLFEVMRWNHMLQTNTDDSFKLCNNYRAYYTRMIEKVRPDLEGFLTKKRSKADGCSGDLL
jgi:hypothetical protein